MHEQTLTALHVSNEKMDHYHADIRNAIDHHKDILDRLSRQFVPNQAVTTGVASDSRKQQTRDSVGTDNNGNDDLDRRIADVACSIVHTISTQGTVVGQVSPRASTYGLLLDREYVGGVRGNTNHTAMEAGHHNRRSPVESRGVRLSATATDDASEDFQDAVSFVENGYRTSFDDQAIGLPFSALTTARPDDVDFMNDLLERYTSEGQADLSADRFADAKKNLLKAIEQGEERKSAYNYPFDDRLDLDISLAKAYIGLTDFDSADRTLCSQIPLVEPPKIGELYYTLAISHRERYRRLPDPALLCRLINSAQISLESALNSTIIRRPFLAESAGILAEAFEWKEDPIRADAIRARYLPKQSDSILPTFGDPALVRQVSSAEKACKEQNHSAEGRSSPEPSLSAALSRCSIDEQSRADSCGTSPTSIEQLSLKPMATASLLHQVQEGDVETTVNLLKMFANVEQIDEETGFTPLLTAAKKGYTQLCEILIQDHVRVDGSMVRANIHAKDKRGRNVLHIALSGKGGKDMISALLEKGADPNLPDIEGRTPLHCCVESNKPKAAQYLLEKNATKEISDRAGETPLSLAIRRQRTALVEILLRTGAIIYDTNLKRTSEGIKFIVARHRANLQHAPQIARPRRQGSESTTILNTTTRTMTSKLFGLKS